MVSRLTLAKGEPVPPEITIHDHPWGSGKTTAMIENLQEDRKYLVILPLLSEVDRIVETATKVHFSQPSENDNEAGTKEVSLEEMFLTGQNIASTHSLHQRLVSMAQRGLLGGYDIIIDEVPEVVEHVAEKSTTSIEEFYCDTGYMLVDQDTGRVTLTMKWWSNKDHVKDTLSPKIIGHAASECLYLLEGKFFIWAMPGELLVAGRTTTIMTFKSERSLLSSYLCKVNVPAKVANDNFKDGSFRQATRELIDVQYIPAISKLKLS